MYQQYLDLGIEQIEKIKEHEGENISKAAKLVGDSIIKGDWVYTFGSGHSQLLALEIHARAGGLYPIVHIPDPMNGRAEKVEGFGPILVEGLPFKKGATIFVISNSGRNPEPIEIAMIAKDAGMNLIAVTSLEHSKSVTSRHSSGKKLFELADIVLDTHVAAGDASLSFEGLQEKAGAFSTVIGAVLMNAVMVESIQYMLDQGHEPPVLISANLDGSDEHNRRIFEKFGPFPTARQI